MSKFFALKVVVWRRLVGVIALLLLAWPARAQYDPDWTRNFRFGGLVGFNIKADFKLSGRFPIAGANPGPVGTPVANHVYDDGYVRIDNTGNAPDENGVHWTTFWGYEDQSQYAGNTLTMHSTTAFTIGTANDRKGLDDAPYIGFDLAYGGCIQQWQRTRLGWELGFGYLPIKISSGTQVMNANVEQVTHEFDTGGVLLPDAPYNGTSSGFGQPSIQDIASLVNTSTNAGTVTGSQELDVTMWAFRLGPTFFWDITPQFGLSLSAGPALGIVTGDLKFDETVQTTTTAQNKERISATELVYGGYVAATLTWHVVPNGDFYVSAQYMPLTSATFSGGGRQAKLNMTGSVFLAGGVNWPF